MTELILCFIVSHFLRLYYHFLQWNLLTKVRKWRQQTRYSCDVLLKLFPFQAGSSTASHSDNHGDVRSLVRISSAIWEIFSRCVNPQSTVVHHGSIPTFLADHRLPICLRTSSYKPSNWDHCLIILTWAELKHEGQAGKRIVELRCGKLKLADIYKTWLCHFTRFLQHCNG